MRCPLLFGELAASPGPGRAAGLGRVARRARSIPAAPLGTATSILQLLPAPGPRLPSAHGAGDVRWHGQRPQAGLSWVPLPSQSHRRVWDAPSAFGAPRGDGAAEPLCWGWGSALRPPCSLPSAPIWQQLRAGAATDAGLGLSHPHPTGVLGKGDPTGAPRMQGGAGSPSQGVSPSPGLGTADPRPKLCLCCLRGELR